MSIDIHARTIPAGGGSDDLISLFDIASESYDTGERADPTEVASGTPWHLALAAVAAHREELRAAVLFEAVEMARRPAAQAVA